MAVISGHHVLLPGVQGSQEDGNKEISVGYHILFNTIA